MKGAPQRSFIAGQSSGPAAGRGLSLSSTARGLVGSATLRFLLLPISGISSLLVARTVSGEFGIEIYGFFALVSTLPSLLPSLDFGYGAAVTNRATDASRFAHDFVETFRSAFARLCFISVGACVVSVGMYFLELWPTLLGLDGRQDVNLPVCIAVCVFFLSLPAGLAGPSLIGFGRNQLLILLQALAPIASLAVVLTASLLGISSLMLVGISTLGVFTANWISFLTVWNTKNMRAARLGSKLPTIPTRRSRRRREFRTAPAMLLITVMGPLTFQSGRLTLSWFSGPAVVGQFSAGMLVFAPIFSLAQVAGRSLWSEFARLRFDQEALTKAFRSAFLICGAIGITGGIAVGIVGPYIAAWATSGTVAIPSELFWFFGAIVFVTALHQPGGMFLTDAKGLRFQAMTSCAMALSTLLFIFSFIGALGLLAPVIGTLIGFTFGQFIPCLLVSLRRLRFRSAEV